MQFDPVFACAEGVMVESNTLITRIVRARTISLQSFLLRELIDF